MLVIVAHECLTSETAVSLSIIESLRHLILHIEVKNLGGPFGGVVQIGSDAQKKIISCFQSPSFGLA